MNSSWVSVKSSSGALVVFVGLICASGCGSSGRSGDATTVYSSPEEVAKENAELLEAMKSGAYGSAGREAARQIDPTRR